MRLATLNLFRHACPRTWAAWLPLLGGMCLILLAVVLLMGWESHTPSARIETNLLALLPNTERNPVAEQAIEHLNTQFSDRIMVAVRLPLETSMTEVEETLLPLAKTLEALPVIRQVTAQVPPLNPNGLRDLYAPHLAGLADLSYWTALQGQDQAALQVTLQQRLYQPLGIGGAPNLLPLAEDPFGLFNRFLAQTPYLKSRLTIEQGWLTAAVPASMAAGKTTEKFVLLIAQLRGSAFSSTLQDQLETWRRAAEQQLHAQQPTWDLWVSGTVRYASVARQSAQQDMDRIGWLSLLGIALLLAWAYRSLGPILLGWMAILVGAAAAVLVVIAVDGKLHLLTLVFGASLLGETIDYAIQFFAARAQAGATWSATVGVQRIRPALRMGLLTSVLGYMALGVLPLAGIRQIALFAAVGLLVAYVMVSLLLPAWLAQPMTTSYPPSHTRVWVQAWLKRWQAPCSQRQAVGLIALAIGVSMVGLWQLKAVDDVRLLNNPPDWLQAQENLLRQATGQQPGLQFFLVEGQDAEEVLQREQRLRNALQPYVQAGMLQGIQALSQMVPSVAQQQAQQRELQAWSARTEIQRALQTAGFTPEASEAWHSKLMQSTPLTLQDWLSQPYATPWRHLWLEKVGPTGKEHVASLVLPLWADVPARTNGRTDSTDQYATLASIAEGLPGVTWVDKTTSISTLLGQLRVRATFGLSIVLGLVGLVLFCRYGMSQALRLLAPTVLALMMTLGLWGWLDYSVTLFHIMALLLVIGVGVNYAIFAHEGQQQIKAEPLTAECRPDAVLLGVGLSACTTLLSFGLLSWSSTPALQHFGSTLATGVLFTLLFTPLCMNGIRRITEGDGSTANYSPNSMET